MLEQLGIKKITIPLPFQLDHVHCFLAEGEKGYTVIDTGLHNDETIAVWDKELDNRPVDGLILTHLHPDHCGYAGTLQEKSGADVWMSKRDAEDIRNIWVPGALPNLQQGYKEAAVPEDIANGIVNVTKKFQPYVSPLPNVNHFLEDGDHIRIGKGNLR